MANMEMLNHIEKNTETDPTMNKNSASLRFNHNIQTIPTATTIGLLQRNDDPDNDAVTFSPFPRGSLFATSLLVRQLPTKSRRE